MLFLFWRWVASVDTNWLLLLRVCAICKSVGVYVQILAFLPNQTLINYVIWFYVERDVFSTDTKDVVKFFLKYMKPEKDLIRKQSGTLCYIGQSYNMVNGTKLEYLEALAALVMPLVFLGLPAFTMVGYFVYTHPDFSDLQHVTWFAQDQNQVIIGITQNRTDQAGEGTQFIWKLLDEIRDRYTYKLK